MATWESEQRMARRRHQRWLEGWRASPEYQEMRRERLAEARKRRRRKFHLFPLYVHCALGPEQLTTPDISPRTRGARPPRNAPSNRP
ncbi:MAG: hypothetical protein ACREOH_22805 [Candidatus Entotheonellia bacterium]